MHTYYEILGVPKDADQAAVKAAYRKLSRTAHPDLGGNAAIFGMIQEAYDTLKDDSKRAAYDESLSAPAQPGPASERPSPKRDPRDPYRTPEEEERAQARAEYAARFESRTQPKVVPLPTFKVALGDLVKDVKTPLRWLLAAVMVGLLPFASTVADQFLHSVGIHLTSEAQEIPDRFGGMLSWFIPLFVVGLIVAPAWLWRHRWRPFPMWERILVCLALVCGAAPAFDSFTGVLVTLGVAAAYLVVVGKLRKPARVEGSIPRMDPNEVPRGSQGARRHRGDGQVTAHQGK